MANTVVYSNNGQPIIPLARKPTDEELINSFIGNVAAPAQLPITQVAAPTVLPDGTVRDAAVPLAGYQVAKYNDNAGNTPAGYTMPDRMSYEVTPEQAARTGGVAIKLKDTPVAEIQNLIAEYGKTNPEQANIAKTNFEKVLVGLSQNASAAGIGAGADSSSVAAKLAADVNVPGVRLLPMAKNKPAGVERALNDPNNTMAARTAANRLTQTTLAQAAANADLLPELNKASAENLGADTTNPNSAVSMIASSQPDLARSIASGRGTYADLKSGFNADGSKKGFWRSLGDAIQAQNVQRGIELNQGFAKDLNTSVDDFNTNLKGAITNNQGMVVDPTLLNALAATGIQQQNVNVLNSNQDIARAGGFNTALANSIQNANQADANATARAGVAVQGAGVRAQVAETARQSDKAAREADQGTLIKTDPGQYARMANLGVQLDPSITPAQAAATYPEQFKQAGVTPGAGATLGTDLYSSYRAGLASGDPATRTQALQFSALVDNATNTVRTGVGKELQATIESSDPNSPQGMQARNKLDALIAAQVQEDALKASQGEAKFANLAPEIYGNSTETSVNATTGMLKNGAALPKGLTTEDITTGNSLAIIDKMTAAGVTPMQQAQFFKDVGESSASGSNVARFAAPARKAQGLKVKIVAGPKAGKEVNLANVAELTDFTAYMAAMDMGNRFTANYTNPVSAIAGMITGQGGTSRYRRERQQGGSVNRGIAAAGPFGEMLTEQP